jgi:tRNA A-37 threonylcarbamoyl transferase component Bud32
MSQPAQPIVILGGAESAPDGQGLSNTQPRSCPDGLPEGAQSAPARIGRFEIRARLGAGAFGTVYRAHDTLLDREVALKVPHASRLQSEQNKTRILREARAAAPLQHPHIVTIHEVGTEGGLPYIVSDFVEGQSLAEWLKSHAIRRGEAVHLAIKIAEALHYAHGKEVIHRDLKPGNIMIAAGTLMLALGCLLAHKGIAERRTNYLLNSLEAGLQADDASANRAVQLESQYKAGVCLARLHREEEAAALWMRTTLVPRERWPALAGCQLLALRLRQKNRAEAGLLLERLAAQELRKPLAQLLPAEFRNAIVDACRPSDRIFLLGDSAELRRIATQMEQARIFWTPGHAEFATAKDLFCAYWMLNRCDEAAGLAKEVVDNLGAHFFEGEWLVYTDPHKYYCWLVPMARGPEAALKEIDRFYLDSSGKPRPSALTLCVERCRYLWGVHRLAEAERDLRDFIPRAMALTKKEGMGKAGMELLDAYLVLGFLRADQDDRAGAAGAWREGLALGRPGYHGSRPLEIKAPWCQAGTHLGCFLLMGALSGDLSTEDVRVYVEWNMAQLAGRSVLPAMVADASQREQFMPLDGLRKPILAVWQHPDGYSYARRLALHEPGRAEHTRMPIVLALREYILADAFSGTPSAEQRKLAGEAVEKLLDALVLGGTDATAATGLAMAWKGNFLGLG